MVKATLQVGFNPLKRLEFEKALHEVYNIHGTDSEERRNLEVVETHK